MPCSICGEPGHNKKSCIVYKTVLAELVDVAETVAETVASIVTEVEISEPEMSELAETTAYEPEMSEPAELLDVNAILFTYYSQTPSFHVLHPIFSCILQPTPTPCQLFKDSTGGFRSGRNKISRNDFLIAREPIAEPHPDHHTLM